MEETLINRLEQIITHVKELSDSADKLNSVSVLDENERKEGEVICQKIEIFTNRFNSDLNNYFRLSSEPSIDDISRFTTIQLQAEEARIELLSKLKEQRIVSNNTHKLSSKLPKLNLPTFDGDILLWQEFWDQYKFNIHERDLSEVDKLLYLKSSLQGPARRTIEGLESTNKNYQIAIDTLRERYGRENQIIDAHYSALYKIQPADTSNKECRRALNEVERHLRVLSSLGEDTSHNHLRFLILEKFPEELVYELKVQVKTDSIEEIRNQLEKTITAREEANRLVQDRGSSKPKTYTVETLYASDRNSSSLLPRRKQPSKQGFRNFHKNLNNFSKERDNKPKGYNKPHTSKGGFHKRYNRSDVKVPNETFQLKHKQQDNNYKRKIDHQDYAKGQRDGKKRKLSCIFCGNDHYNDQCIRFTTIRERKERLNGLCYHCMKGGHVAKECRIKRTCKHCGGRHNRALCPKVTSTERNLSTNMCAVTKGNIVLQTAIAKAMRGDDESEYESCRLLLDSGSQRSYVTENLARKLKLKVKEECRLSVFTFGASVPIEYDSKLVKIHLKSRTNKRITIYANVVPVISHHVPYMHQNIYEARTESIMADDGSLGERIDILIGNDYYFSLISTNKITIQENLFLVDSQLGWILTGQLATERGEPELKVITYMQSHEMSKLNKPDLPLDKFNMKTLWELESIGIVDSPKATREEEAVRNFNETTQFIEGRYAIRWPWKEYPPDLPSNFGVAFGRLVNLVKRLDSTSLRKYDETFKNQLNEGIIETVPERDHFTETPVHYLPHHGIQQPDKPTRIVYDASTKTKEHKSLNDCLYCGPSLIEDLTSLLIRFRTHRIGLSADVEKAFLQIAIQKDDRDVTRFLWIKDITKPVSQENLLHLRFCRVPFGVISSPFLLNATIKHHLSKNSNRLRGIVDDIYVDNLVSGTDTVKEALDLYDTSKRVFQEISMNLRSWNSNSKEFMRQIADTGETETVKVLGLDWHLNDDTIKLRHENTKEAKTKREVLRNIAKVYDPCGFAAPSLLPGKIFLQNLWKENYIKWDTLLPSELISKWEGIRTDLDEVAEVCLSRHITKSRPEDNQLHCFTDASTKAYAAVVYVSNKKGRSFVIGKSRLVPIKDKENLKIPRLELLGAVIGNRLLKYVEKSLRMEITQQYLWTDSQIVIDWINSYKLLTPFVARRVNEIKENKKVIIRYVPTELNPADVGTRPGKTRIEKSYWLRGPDFLSLKEMAWPSSRLKDLSLLAREGLSETEKTENKESKVKNQTNQKKVTNKVDIERNTREGDNYRSENRSTIKEIKFLQEQNYPEEFKEKITPLSRNLGLFIDVDGLLRCKGRLTNANWSYDKRYPILLPKNCEFTNKLIIKVHEENYHVGANHTLSIIRELYWIPQGKSQVQKVLRRCSKCVKHGGGPYQLPETTALPPERVNYSSPFTYTGLDYLGPVLVNTETGVMKRWICLYTCLAVRAIHMEVVKNMTAEETLLALRRMISIRGIPKVITSDNAQQFKLTAEVLEQPFCKQNNIRWKFIPQLAPWFGGFYERLVGLTKHCMKRTLQKHLLNDSQLLTIVKEIEAVLNTRPLTCVDAERDHILKPSDFLAMSKCLNPEVVSEDLTVNGTITKIDLVQSWKRGVKILEEFKAMFVNRYLPSLRERYRHTPKEPRVRSKLAPEIGQVVQIKGNNPNRHSWKVGKIIEVSENGRTAKVGIDNTEYIRSVGHLYPLEADEEDCGLSSSEYNPDTRFASDDAPEMELDLNHVNKLNNETREIELEQRNNERETQVPVETEAEPPSKGIEERTHENQNDTELNNDERPKRAAATRALERIREWTQNLHTMF